MRRDDVDETEDGNKRHTDEPHDHLLPESQRLQETHLRAVPDARQVLLTVRMCYKLYSRRSSTQQQHQLFTYYSTAAWARHYLR